MDYEAEETDDQPQVSEPTEKGPVDPKDTDAIVRAAKAARANGPRNGPEQAYTCLVVDDSRVIRKLASTMMRNLGYQVIEAENGEEALKRCQQSMPDVILTDWSMPVMSGLEFVNQLRAMPEAQRVKVVFCTSKGASQDIHDGIRAGADDYIVKPFEESALKAKLDSLQLD